MLCCCSGGGCVRGCAINNFKLKSGGGERHCFRARRRRRAFDRQFIEHQYKTRGTKRAAPRWMEINCQWGKNLSPNTWLLPINMAKKYTKRLPEGWTRPPSAKKCCVRIQLAFFVFDIVYNALWRKLVLVHCAVFLLSTTQHSRRAFYWLSACEREKESWMGMSFLTWARSFSTPFCPLPRQLN